MAAAEAPTEIMGFVVTDGAVISGFAAGTQRGFALTMPAGALTTAAIRAAVADIAAKAGAAVAQLELKVVGSTGAVRAVERLFKELGLTLKATAVCEASKTSIYFYCRSGRLRLERAPVAAAPIDQASPVTLASRKVRVLVVDDSETIRRLLTKILDSSPEMEVVGSTGRPSEVESLLVRLRPDVLTLDIHMPEMDGVTLLRQLLPRHRIPTVMISSLAREEGPMVLAALEAGAVD